MSRRRWCALAASGLSGLLAPRVAHSLGDEVGRTRIRIDEEATLEMIAPDFLGLGYEISSPARPGLLSATDQVYVRMVQGLAKQGVIRIGGNTADYASYAANGTAVSAPKGTVVNRESLRQLATFLDATGWKLIWSLNLGKGTATEAVEEAQAVVASVGNHLLGLEIGNEVDLFTHEGHRKEPYPFRTYLAEYRQFKAAVRAKLPQVPLIGPDVAGRTEWVREFAAAEAPDVALLTEHYYRGGQSAASSLDMLLKPDQALLSRLSQLQEISKRLHIPYRICETNSFSGGGRPGISGTFGAGLWTLDYLWTLASFGAAGVNVETGVNQLGFISSYSPIGDDEHGTYTAMPEYYGMLAFAHGSSGRRVATKREGGAREAGDLNLTSYAVTAGRQVVVTLINKELTRDAVVEVRCKQQMVSASASAMHLRAPSLSSSVGVTLGSKAVGADGRWVGGQAERIAVAGGALSLHVPAASATVLTAIV